MKNIRIKKSNYFSSKSKIYVHVGSRKIRIDGFGLYTIPINAGEYLFASQMWTGSDKIAYEMLDDGELLVIEPKLSRLFALIVGIIFILCSIIAILTRYRWSFLPLVPLIIYIGLYLTVLRNRYLIIKKEQMP